MEKTLFEISKMDCPSEENLIRMKLDGISAVKNLQFDIPNRKLTVKHEGDIELIEEYIEDLNLGAIKIKTEHSENSLQEDNQNSQRKALWIILVINFSFFLIEMTFGILANSMGLVADSLDMLADSLVYALSLFAVGSSLIRKKRIAKLAGYFQIVLALVGFSEIIRRFFYSDSMPIYTSMVVVSIFALIANSVSLYVLQKSKDKEEAHMKASMIFTSNDIIINSGVILAGVLVYLLNSKIPDLVIGGIVFYVVIQGARRILKLGQ